MLSLNNSSFSIKRVLIMLGMSLTLMIAVSTLYSIVWGNGYQTAIKRYAAQSTPTPQQQFEPSPSPSDKEVSYSGNIDARQLQLSAQFETQDGHLKVWVKSLADPIPNSPVESEWQTYAPNRSLLVFEEKLNQPAEHFLGRVSSSQTMSEMGVSFPVAWANKKRQLVIFMPHKFTIIDVAVDAKNLVSITNKHIVDVPFSGDDERMDYRMFYTGDDSKIFISRRFAEKGLEDHSFLYSFAQNTFQDITQTVPNDAYAVPNSSQLAYFKNKKLVLWDSGVTREFNDPSKEDYRYAILFSPQRDFVCLNTGSSGSYFFEVYAFPSMRAISTNWSGGFSESCLRWRNNTRIIVRIDDGLYEFDVSTGKKEFLYHL